MHKLAQKPVYTKVPEGYPPYIKSLFLFLTEVLINFFFIFVRLARA